MYSVHGTFLDRPADVLWDDGHVDGSDDFMVHVYAYLKADPGTLWGPPGGPAYSGEAVFGDPWAFLFLVLHLMPDGKVADGELPELPEFPDGAITGA